MNKLRHIYLDYSATTPMSKEVYSEMESCFYNYFGNPSSMHHFGTKSKRAINSARERIASCINSQANEIYFCSGGSEANNWALKGVALRSSEKKEIITTAIEHHSIINTCKFLEKHGFKVKYMDVDKHGFVDLRKLERAITKNTLLVSLMMANNEIGTIQDFKSVGEICREKNVIFHTDAVQAVGHIEINLNEINADLLSMSSHKFYGPKGVGCLYIRNGIDLENLIHGGGQEKNKRAGTENTLGIMGMAKALELEIESLSAESERQRRLCRLFMERLTGQCSNIRINGPQIGDNRLPGNLNISFRNVDNLMLSYLLDKKGIYISTGSACNSDSIEPSHVLKAIKVPDEYINGSIRISLGKKTTKDDIEIACSEIIDVISNNKI